MTALQGVRWIAVELDGERWPFAYVAYVEFGASETAGANDPLFGGNDGCNWVDASGSLDGDRLNIGQAATTLMDCGPGTGEAIPADGDRLRLSDDGSTLDVVDRDGHSRLTYVRADGLTAASPDDLIGSWQLDPDDPVVVAIDADGAITFGACRWSWRLEEKLTVSGFPSDPYSCLGVTPSQTPSRLVEMFVNGPVDARLSTQGDLYLTDAQFVIRLTPQPSD
jgi:hypothetical protein